MTITSTNTTTTTSTTTTTTTTTKTTCYSGWQEYEVSKLSISTLLLLSLLYTNLGL